MFNLYIFNIERFLEVVNNCHGPVYIFSENGNKVDIKGNKSEQMYLQRKFRENGDVILLSLDISIRAQDYLKIVNSSIMY